MIPAITAHKDFITVVVAVLGILVTLLFGHFKNWRHRICFEYSSTKSAAITALRDSFQEEASKHFEAVQRYVEATGSTAQEFYSQSEPRKYVKLLGLKIERINQLIRYHSFLLTASQIAEIALWVVVLMLLISLGSIRWDFSHLATWLITCIATLASVVALASICVMLYFEGRFVAATHNALKPEFE